MKKLTKSQMENVILNYERSNLYNLYDCYERFSSAKAKAFEYCKDLMAKKNGKALKIIGYNSNCFSAGFVYEEDGQEMFCYITKDYDRVFSIPS